MLKLTQFNLRFLLAFAAMWCCVSLTVAQQCVVPAPRQVRQTKGSLNPASIEYISVVGAEMPVLYGLLERLPRVATGGPGITLAIDSVAELGSEGYKLDITPRSISVKANTEAGLFYGAVTLAQIVQQALDSKANVEAMSIIDFPALEVRAVHFDTKHHLDRTQYYYSLIDQLANWKINTIIWEIEDKLRYERRPECASPNALSKQEMRAIADYAKARHIDINPLVQGLGHAGFILKNHWELRENPASDWEFCPSNPETYLLQFDLYRDALEAFPHGKYLHVGGDEITQIGIDKRCLATGKSPFELQMEWLDKVCTFAKENGRTPIFWDDMPLKFGDIWWLVNPNLSKEEVDEKWSTQKLDQAIDLFPKECVYMRWLYGDPDFYAHHKLLQWYKDKGLPVMAATAAADGGSPYMPRHESKISEIRAFCRLAVDNNFKDGILATCWDDGSPHWETVKRGFAALGEYSWNPSGRSIDEFKDSFARNYFGLPGQATAFIEELETAAGFFDKALVCAGRRNPAWQVREFTLIDLPDADSPGKWTEKYRVLLDSADVQINRCKAIARRIKDAADHARQNRFTLAVYDVNNQLFLFPARLLKSLEAYDNAVDSSSREEARRQVMALCDEFNATKERLTQTYGTTRFMEQPVGYVSDLNHHKHLAALTPDASWLFLYENAFIASLRSNLK